MENQLSDFFEVKTGLKQGCLLSPCLFNIYIDHVVRDALADIKFGIRFKYKMPDGRVRDGTNVSGEELLNALLYADDMVIMCENMEVLQLVMTRLFEIADKWCLTINIGKTKVLNINEPANSNTQKKRIEINNEYLEEVDSFTHLGSVISKSSTCQEEISKRIGSATGKFYSLNKSVWKQSGVRLQIYQATVLSVL